MKKVKLLNCIAARESNTGEVVYLYETTQELLTALPNAKDPYFLNRCVKDSGFVGFVINNSEDGDWIQVYKDEIK